MRDNRRPRWAGPKDSTFWAPYGRLCAPGSGASPWEVARSAGRGRLDTNGCGGVDPAHQLEGRRPMFDYRMTDEQEEYQRIAHEFARDEIRPISLELDHQQDPAQVRLYAPSSRKTRQDRPENDEHSKEYGGGGVDDLLTHCIVGEEISWGDRGATGFMLSSHEDLPHPHERAFGGPGTGGLLDARST